jgi:hypothetical protein
MQARLAVDFRAVVLHAGPERRRPKLEAVEATTNRYPRQVNILCASSGHIFLTDFGIVRLVDATGLTAQGTIGTVSYLSPEQVRGEDVDASGDIYSLGVVVLECLTGRPEYPGRVDGGKEIS